MALLKTTFTVTVLHEADDVGPHLTNLSLLDIANEINDGDLLGQMHDMKTVPVPEGTEVEEQIALGSDGTFFQID